MAIRIENNRDSCISWCDSVQDMIQLFLHPEQNATQNADMAKYERDWAHTKGDSWLGVPGSQIDDTLTHGWREGAERLAAMQRPEVGIGRTNRRRRVRGDHGDSLDPHAVMRGDLGRAWERTRRTESKAPLFVTIWANCGLMGKTSAEQAFWRGAAIVAICDALTLAGHQVEVIGYRYSASGTFKANKAKHQAYFVPVKRFDDRLDVELLATVTCLAGFHRTAGWAVMLNTPNEVRQNKGYSEQSPRPPRSIVEAHGSKHNIGVPLFDDEAHMRQWLGDWEREFNNEHTNRDAWR